MLSNPSKNNAGIDYQFNTIIYIAGCLSKKENVQDYWIYTNRDVDLFDDMIVKYTDGRQYFIYFCQIKYKADKNDVNLHFRRFWKESKRKKGKSEFVKANNFFDLEKYLDKIHNIMDQSKREKFLKELLEGVPESNIEFWLFFNSSFWKPNRWTSDPLERYIMLNDVPCFLQPYQYQSIPFGNEATCYSFIKDGHGQFPLHLEKFYVFLNQPDNVASITEKLGIDLFTDKPAKEMITFVNLNLKRATNVTMLRKNIFEAHLLNACLTNFIVGPTEAFVMKPELAQTWNELVKQFDVTLTSSETKPYLYGCLSQKIREHFGDFDWNEIIRGSYIIPEAETIEKELKEHFKNTEMEYWLGECGTIQDLLKTLWECGYLPLVLSGNFDVSILNNYRHLGNKRFVLLADNGISNLGLRVFASAADIHGIKLGKDFLESILISMQGREPVQLSSILNGDIDLMKELKCEQLLYLIREREDLLRSVERSENSKIITENGNYFYIKNVDDGEQVVPIIGKCFTDTEKYLKRRLCEPTVEKTIRDSERKVICLLTGDLNSIDWSKSNYYNLLNKSIDSIVSRVEPQTKQNEAAFIGTKDEHVAGLSSQFSSSEHALLHIEVERGTMILLKYRNFTNINSYISYDGPKFQEDFFFEETAAGITVITGEPGSGKSTLLRSLFNTCDKHSFALFCDLKNYQQDLNDDKSDLFKDPINFILRKEEAQLTLSNEQYSKHHLNFLRKLLEKTKELILFLDSFDEVLPKSQKQVLEFIKKLNESKGRLVIASRLIMADILANSLEVKLLKIDALSKTDIEKYINDQALEAQLKKYPLGFLENPMYLNFLITLQGSLPSHSTSSALYNAIIDDHIKRFYGRNEFQPKEYEEKREELLWIFKKLAVMEVFSVTAELKSEYEKLRDKCNYRDKSKSGLIVQFNDEGPIFFHRTIAEFLVAERIIEKIHKETGKELYMMLEDHKQITYFMNDILCRDLVLHQAVIYKDLDEVKRLCSEDDKHLREVDKLNRSALYVAAICCSDYKMEDVNCQILEEIVQQIILKGINSFERNSLTNSHWTDYLSRRHERFLYEVSRLKLARTAEMYFYCKNEIAEGITWCIENDMLDIAMALLRKDRSLLDSCFRDFIFRVVLVMRSDLLFELIEFKSSTNPEFNELCRACRNLSPTTELSGLANLKMEYWGFTAIHIACISGSADVVRELISLGVDANAVDAFGRQPLYYAIRTCSTEILTILAKSFKREANISDKWGSPVYPDYLHICIRKNRLDIAKILLDEGFDKDEKDEYGRTALHIAVENCSQEYAILQSWEMDIPKPDDDDPINQIEFLLDHKLNVNARDINGETPLHIAIECRRLDVIEMLLRYGANPNIEGRFEDRTPVWTAIENRNHEAMTLLLEYDGNICKTDSYGRTPLFALFRDNDDNYSFFIDAIDYSSSVQYLLNALVKAGADVNHQDNDGNTALMTAIDRSFTEIPTLLLENGADVNLQNKHGNTALHIALIDRSDEPYRVAEALVEKGANVNHQNNDGKTAIMIAVYEKFYEIATMLLESGAEVNLQDKDGNTALHKAVIDPYDEPYRVAEALVEKGANVNHQNNDGETAIMIAVYEDFYEIATMLLENGADVNLQDKDGNTALHKAVIDVYDEPNRVAEALVEKGANVNHQNNDGETALMIAAYENFYEIATMLLESGAEVNLQDNNGNTALHKAVIDVYDEPYRIAEALVKARVNVDHQNNDGETALMFAAYYNLYKIATMLLESGAEVNLQDKYGESALHYAVTACFFEFKLLSDMEIIEMLLKGDADNRDKIKGARARRAADLLKMLMDKEANVDAVNGRGRTALNVAIHYKTLISHSEEAAGSSDEEAAESSDEDNH